MCKSFESILKQVKFMTSTWSMRNSTTQHGIDDLVIRRPETMVEPVEETFVGANTTNHTTWPGDGWGVVCKVKKFLYLLHDNWSSLRCTPSGDDSKITNFAVSLINISSICFRISTYCLAKTVKSEFVLHSIADSKATRKAILRTNSSKGKCTYFCCFLEMRFQQIQS